MVCTSIIVTQVNEIPDCCLMLFGVSVCLRPFSFSFFLFITFLFLLFYYYIVLCARCSIFLFIYSFWLLLLFNELMSRHLSGIVCCSSSSWKCVSVFVCAFGVILFISHESMINGNCCVHFCRYHHRRRLCHHWWCCCRRRRLQCLSIYRVWFLCFYY